MAKRKIVKKRAPKLIDRESTIDGLIQDAMSEIQCLAEEMREAYDNTPESLQNDGVGAARGEAADNLENISEPNLPEVLQGDKFVIKYKELQLSPSKMRNLSRASRRDRACDDLRHVIEYLENIEDEENLNAHYTDEEREAASELKDEIQNIIDEAEGVDFPGMYG